MQENMESFQQSPPFSNSVNKSNPSMPRNSAEVSINSCQVGGLTHPTKEAICLKGEAKLLNFAGAKGKAS